MVQCAALVEAMRILKKNDGSLPEISIDIDIRSANHLYAYLKGRSSGFCHSGATCWSTALSLDVEIRWSDSASDLIELADCQSFHVVLGHIQSEKGKAVPDLGVYLDATSLVLDYRMGQEWTEDAVEGLFEILSSLLRISGATTFAHRVNQFDIDGRILVAAWEAWQRARLGK